MEGSRQETDGEQGSKARFLGPDGNGMMALIKTSDPYNFMSFKHLGFIKDGVEDTTSEKVKDWKGAEENYTLAKTDSKTVLIVEMDVAEEYMDDFQKALPMAL